MMQYARYALILIVLVIIQKTLIPFISLVDVTPDVLLIFVVIVALREGQIAGTVFGFVVGFVIDIVSGEFLGLSALTKTIAGFTAGYFYNEMNPLQILGTYTFFVVIAVAAVVHNIIHYAILFQGLPVSVTEVIVKFVIGSTFYTVVISLIMFFYYNAQSRFLRT